MSTALYIQQMANKYGLNTSIFSAMLDKESGQRHYSSNGSVIMGGAGEIGIGQIKPGTAAELGIDPYDEKQNIEGAAKYLSQQLRATGNYREALAAYNQGLAGSRGRRQSEGLAYADSVLSNSGAVTLPEFVQNGIAANQRTSTGSALFDSIRDGNNPIGVWDTFRLGREGELKEFDQEFPTAAAINSKLKSGFQSGAFVIGGIAILIVGLVMTNNSAKNFVISKVKGV